jgi:hypothetical protein
VRRDAGPVILDRDLDVGADPRQRDPHGAFGRRERTGIVDQIVEDLGQAAVVPHDDVGLLPERVRFDPQDRRGLSPRRRSLASATTASISFARSTASASVRASSASRREASEMSLISRSSRFTSCWTIDISLSRDASLRASGNVSTALRSEVSGFFTRARLRREALDRVDAV